MAVPAKVPIIPSPAIASYSYTDLANGLGYVDYFLIDRRSGTSATYSLVDNQNQFGVVREIEGDDPDEFDFDSSTFNATRTVDGTAYFNCWAEKSNGSDTTLKLTATVYKVDPSNNETQIGTGNATSGTITSPPTSSTSSFNIPITLTKTTIPRGDKLRLTIKFEPTTGATDHVIGTDPTDGDATNITPSSTTNATTVSRLSMPFRIDIS